MAVTFAQAAKRIQQKLLRGVGLGVATADEFTSMLPVEVTDSVKIDWNVEASLGSGAQIIEHGGAITESAATTNLSGAYLERFVDEVKIPNGLSVGDSTFQTVSKAKALGRKLADQIIEGAGSHTTPVSIYGLETYAVNTQAMGGALTLAGVDSLIDEIEEGADNLVLVMNKSVRRKLTALLRGAGGAQMIEYAQKMVPTYNGIPFLVNDFIDSDEGTGTQSSMYAVSMNPSVTTLYVKGGSVGSQWDGMFEMTEPFDTPGYDSKTIRLGLSAALVIRSPYAVARLTTIDTA